ncbi:hypothetical protein E2562_004102 [Oryza meyeriana var. granulata]|uniref:Uncharacterized protein n=1 Tax=Oryza meyeriana var. granulata TaxID=110450 RepID=A0A6G1EV23_9ORYZ|nr:hypothetical protein E2562_004102 [Oryza meyeriana var. granulata]
MRRHRAGLGLAVPPPWILPLTQPRSCSLELRETPTSASCLRRLHLQIFANHCSTTTLVHKHFKQYRFFPLQHTDAGK